MKINIAGKECETCGIKIAKSKSSKLKARLCYKCRMRVSIKKAMGKRWGNSKN